MLKSNKLSLLVMLILVSSLFLVSGLALAQTANLTLMYQNSGEEDGDDWMEKTIEMFLEANPNVNFEIMANTWGDQYLTQITTMMATGRTPDIFATWTSGRLEPFVEAGRLHDLSGLLEQDPELYDFLQPGPLASTTFDGGIYAIPHNLNAEFMYYNKEVLNELGVTPPQTWDEFLNIIEVAKANGIIPIALGNAEIWTGTIIFMMIAERVAGLDVIEEIMNGERPWTDEAMIETGNVLQELMAMGAFESNVNGIRPEEARGKFMSGDAAFWFQGTWEIGLLNHQMGEDKYGVMSLPAMPDGNGSVDHHIVFADQAWAIGENSRHKDVAWEFIKFMYSPERQEALVRGRTMPATKVEVDPATADPRQVDALNLMASAEGTMFPWDIPLGPFLGTEINKAVQLLYMGQSPEQVFEQFQRTVNEAE